MNKVYQQFKSRRQLDLRVLANQLELDFGVEILEYLTGENLTRRGQRVRLFDQTVNTAEVYCPADRRGKPYVYNFQLGKC